MSLTPLKRLKDAIRFKLYNLNTTYLVLGGLTPWADESAPPAVPTNVSTIEDAFAAVKCTVRIVKEDSAGVYSVSIPGTTPGTFIEKKFSEIVLVSDVLAWTGNIFVMLQANVLDANITGVSFFRKIGFSTDLIPLTGHESDSFLASGLVTSWGQIESLEYRRPYPVISGSQHNFYQIIQY